MARGRRPCFPKRTLVTFVSETRRIYLSLLCANCLRNAYPHQPALDQQKNHKTIKINRIDRLIASLTKEVCFLVPPSLRDLAGSRNLVNLVEDLMRVVRAVVTIA